MKRINLTFAFVIFLTVTAVFGQQDPQYTQYMYNMNVINPAYAGSRGTLSLGMLGRKQWTDIDGAPKTATFSVVKSSAMIALQPSVPNLILFANFSFF